MSGERNPENRKHLIPFTQRSPAEQHAIQSKGGRTVTDKQRFAAKVREVKKRMRKGQLSTDDEIWLLKRIEDPASFSIDLLDIFDQATKIARETGMPINPALMNAGINLYKAIHGEKKVIQGQHLHMHMHEQMSPDEMEDLLGEMDEL